MARITVEDCLDHVDNRFDLVIFATKRARQLANGVEPLIPWANDKPTVVALREIAEGVLTQETVAAVEVETRATPGRADPGDADRRGAGGRAGDRGALLRRWRVRYRIPGASASRPRPAVRVHAHDSGT